MNDPLRVAVVGAGGWGQQHARVFAQRQDTDLVAIVGRDHDRTSAHAERWGTRGYTDLHGMLDAERPDLVTISLPNEHHFATTLEIIRSGTPLFVEKPLVFDLDEADALLREAAERDLFFGIDFNHRFAEPVQRAKAAVDADELGRVVFATWRFGGSANYGTSRHANLIETQCHGFDLLEHLVGPITSVMAQMTDVTYGDWSTLALALEFEGGPVGTMLGTYDSSYAYPDSQLIEINGVGGRAVIHDTVRELELSRADHPETRVWRAGYFDDEARSFHRTFDRHVDAVLAAFRDGRQPPVHARDGRRALELAHAAVVSHETGTRIATTRRDVDPLPRNER
ncbi:Gfo/Idh/MocA family oxidoreductase [Galbitalea sp. SE-J8]|uniref:Gfo/Idh/MocA family protein n=1 Tax=Galbitalea sp. SE-J8 TaxID=3054952 RepID=UPI00259D2C05|nr:Gfo/Idh/MocA family oxidoreductase [Galbitalea sp. SE-J8]MDM4761659.1 Gfo/Idh/MocA family oxidoreductase [Galbitalea sp. SE-J8]